MFRSVRVVAVAVSASAAIAMIATASVADIHATGRWVIRGTLPFPLGGPFATADDWSQTGVALTTSSGFTGSIDPASGAITTARGTPNCADTLTGTVAADGLSFTGFQVIRPLACLRPGFGTEVTAARCPSGTIEPGEGCDDGNRVDGDGCDDVCAVEACWSCAGTPSSCTPTALCASCSNGVIDPGEGCDDGNGVAGDGCGERCAVESCWACSGAPSSCTPTACDTCGNASVERAEQCDDGNGQLGDGCGFFCQTEPCWRCSGNPSSCTPKSAGTPCAGDDRIACTSNGICDAAQACTETPVNSLCAAGDACTIERCDATAGCVSAPNPCDDGNPCTADSCSVTCLHTPVVRTDCRPATPSTLLLKHGAAASGDTLSWQWLRGASTDQDFADPRASASYRFCVFAGPDHATIAAVTLAPDASRWQATQKGYRYRQPAAALGSSGSTRVSLIGGHLGHATIALEGRGALLGVAAPPFALPVTAQLLNSQSNVCWTSSYDATDVRQNAAG